MYKKSTRILGIDPGTTIIGYGLIETGHDGLSCLGYGVLRVKAGTESENRVSLVYDFLGKLIKKYQPDKAAIEKLFFFKNAKTITRVSETRGVLLLALQKNGVPIQEFTPLQVKRSVSNYGRADKKQIQKNVSLVLRLKKVPEPDDAADALAIAICCANTSVFD